MALENTDKALASLIDTARELSTQLSPDVYSAASQVAMLSVQGDIMTAHVWLVVSILPFILGVLFFWICFGDTEGDGSTGIAGFFFFVCCFVMIAINIGTLYSPLTQAAAHDPKMALAIKVMSRM